MGKNNNKNEATERADESLSALSDAFEDLANALTAVDTSGVQYNYNTTAGLVSSGGATYPIGGPFSGGGYTFAPTYPTTIEWNTSCPGGHVADNDDLVYEDGVVVSHCVTCRQRLVMNRLPGGVSFLELQHLLGRIMSLDAEVLTLDEVNVSDIIGELAAVRDNLEKEEFALRQARKVFDLAEQVLATKVNVDE